MLRTFLLSLSLIVFSGCTVTQISSEKQNKPLRAAPDFFLPRMNLKPGEGTLAQYRGKVVVLNFFASWCTQCVEEMPTFNRLAKRLSDGEFSVIGVAIDDEPRALQAFLEQNPASFPVFFDMWERAKIDYEVTSLPTTYIIDKKGMIRLAPEPESDGWTDVFLGPRQWTMARFVNYLEDLKNED